MKDSKNLFKLKLFWTAIFIPLIIAITLMYFILRDKNLTYSPDLQGITYLFEMLKIPIGFLALIFPFVALIVANHRSQLSLNQLVETSSQNAITNYFKHLQEYDIYINGVADTDQRGLSSFISIILNNIRNVHAKFYASMYDFNPLINEQLIKKIQAKADLVYSLILEMNNRPQISISNEIYNEVKQLINDFSLNTSDYDLLGQTDDNKKIREQDRYDSYPALEFGVKYTFYSLNSVLRFSGQDLSSESMINLCSLGRSPSLDRTAPLNKIDSSIADDLRVKFIFNDTRIC